MAHANTGTLLNTYRCKLKQESKTNKVPVSINLKDTSRTLISIAQVALLKTDKRKEEHNVRYTRGLARVMLLNGHVFVGLNCVIYAIKTTLYIPR